MPFDGKVSDYFETKPVPVYDRDNPPPTMAEAIRMAVADVEAQERLGIQYDWMECERCTAGAVCRRLGAEDRADWRQYGQTWEGVLDTLSLISMEWTDHSLRAVFCEDDHWSGYWKNAGFGRVPDITFTITPYKKDPAAFKRDMLALADRLEAEAV